MAIKKISQFTAGTPTDDDYILFEQNGAGKSAKFGDFSLTLEEIQASTDLTGKVASASALKLLNTYFDYNFSYTSSLQVIANGFKFYNARPTTEGNPTSDDYYIVLSFSPANDGNYAIQIACSYTNQDTYIRRKWSEWGPWKKINN